MFGEVTLVAFYRSKLKELHLLLETCQGLLTQHLGHFYLPYKVEQVHATIVGLEGYRVNSKIRPARHTLSGNSVEIELDRALAYLRDNPLLPMQVRIGGFRKNVDYGFRSRGKSPYEKSFSLRDKTATLIGWPVAGDSYPSTLFQLRKDLEQFGILHKYHEVGVPDNDLYFVLGQLSDDSVPNDIIEAAIHEVRQHLSNNPLTVGLSVDDLWVVKYTSPTLATESSQSWQLTNIILAQDFLLSLYEENP